MAAAATPELELELESPWRYTGELLSNVHALRLYLSPPSLPLHHSLHLHASFSTPSLSLRCSWTSHGGASSQLLIPLPLLLYDHSAPIHCSAFADHFQFRIQLLPVDFPLSGGAAALKTSLKDIRNEDGAVSLCREVALPNRDAETLKSQEDVIFYCRGCSTKLSMKPFMNILQLPSVNWREVAEHWFGTCCSFGSESELLIAKFEKIFGLKQGTCLVGSASCYINFKDVIRDSILETEIGIGSLDSGSETHELTSEKVPALLICHEDGGNDILGSPSCSVGKVSRPLGCCRDVNFEHDILSESPYNTNEEVMKQRSNGCTQQNWQSHDHSLLQRIPDYALPGNCFLTQETEIAKKIKWVPIHCSGCSSLLGACPIRKDVSDLDMQGVHFLKCQISTSEMAGSSCDTFRLCTIQNVFAMELQAIMEDNASHRYLIRDLSSKLPLLQVVVLNYDSLIFMGTSVQSMNFYGDSNSSTYGGTLNSSEGVGKPLSGNANLKPIVKVLFVDCSSFMANEIRVAEEWASQYDVETIYMMEEVVDALRNALITHTVFFPAASNSFQKFQLSYIDR